MLNFGFLKERQWNSRIYDLKDKEEKEQYDYIIAVLKDLDWVVNDLVTVTTADKKKANIHVGVKKDKTTEIWLIKHGFERAL